jgi:hypothetical protein
MPSATFAGGNAGMHIFDESGRCVALLKFSEE